MPLSPTTAQALASNICTALDVNDTSTQEKWESIIVEIYNALKADITMTILALSIDTAGSATNQVGPSVPVPINPD